MSTAPAPAAAGGCGAGRISAPVSGTTTGTYGEARSGHSHAGKDIAAPSGTTVRAAQCGTVTQAGAVSGGYGNLVCIQHAGGVTTCYAHLNSVATSKGSFVHVGDVIGTVGCTGSCTGPHLHFEVRENNKPVNPDTYLSGSKSIPAAATPATTTTTVSMSVSAPPSDTQAQAAAEEAAAAQAAAAQFQQEQAAAAAAAAQQSPAPIEGPPAAAPPAATAPAPAAPAPAPAPATPAAAPAATAPAEAPAAPAAGSGRPG